MMKMMAQKETTNSVLVKRFDVAKVPNAAEAAADVVDVVSPIVESVPSFASPMHWGEGSTRIPVDISRRVSLRF